MYSTPGRQTSLWRGCPIRNLRAHRSHAAPPERFAGLRVLHRPSAPRHPPRTLSRLSFYVCLLTAPHTLLPRFASPRLQTTAPSSSVSVLFSFSALGKIEVIILFISALQL